MNGAGVSCRDGWVPDVRMGTTTTVSRFEYDVMLYSQFVLTVGVDIGHPARDGGDGGHGREHGCDEFLGWEVDTGAGEGG